MRFLPDWIGVLHKIASMLHGSFCIVIPVQNGARGGVSMRTFMYFVR